ncbi:MAG: type II secretion system minor pseudopilin GspH [Woeseiaceae bacterium]|nr:type II secretion system minor pseudopilin GspH [Woeseiaceae bacterium]
MTFRRAARGFSLIEILVVVFVVGVVASIALLSVGLAGDDRELETEARRFAALMERAQDEAVLQGREFGLEVMQNGYRFVEYDPFVSQWAELFGDDIFRQRSLPDGTEFELFLEGQRIALEPEPAEFDDPDAEPAAGPVASYEPHVFVFSSGETSPFELRILRPATEDTVIVRREPLGAVEIVDDDGA